MRNLKIQRSTAATVFSTDRPFRYHWFLYWDALESFWSTHKHQVKHLALAGVFKILWIHQLYVRQVWRSFGTVLRVVLPMAKAATQSKEHFQQYARRLHARHKRLLAAGEKVSHTDLPLSL